MNTDHANWNHWAPNADVYVTEGKLVAKIELAGLQPENLEVSVDGNRLVISGERTDGSRTAPCKFHASEIRYGAFRCAVQIPDGYDITRSTAIYRNGFLRIEVPAHQGRMKPDNA